MVRCVLSLVLALQLLLPAHTLQTLLAAAVPAPAAEAATNSGPKVCPCNGKIGCKCCGCNEDPETEAAPAEPEPDPGPHGCIRCPCKVAESLATANVYLPNRNLVFQALCQPQQEWLPARAERWLSPVLPVDSPPPKNLA